jgi:hypothetical protein
MRIDEYHNAITQMKVLYCASFFSSIAIHLYVSNFYSDKARYHAIQKRQEPTTSTSTHQELERIFNFELNNEFEIKKNTKFWFE